MSNNESEINCLDQFHGKNFSLYHGDCCDVIRGLPENSIDFCIHSPPFANLYIYSDSEADMGNCRDTAEFCRHYQFLIGELHRVTVPGRLCAVHCKDLPKYRGRDGEAGLADFPGAIIWEFEQAGWTYHSRVTIWKCPVTERERTNNHGLLHKTLIKDSSALRQGMADYLLVFRKNTQEGLLSDKPVERPRGLSRYLGDDRFNPFSSTFHPSPFSRTGTRGVSFADALAGDELESPLDRSVIIWRRYAEPVWWDIDQTDVLNFKLGTTDRDEKHICPLQLGLIKRAVDLWTNPGDVVLTPFAGVGSEVVSSLQLGRKAIGIELKESYFKTATRFCTVAERDADRPTLNFEMSEVESGAATACTASDI